MGRVDQYLPECIFQLSVDPPATRYQSINPQLCSISVREHQHQHQHQQRQPQRMASGKPARWSLARLAHDFVNPIDSGMVSKRLGRPNRSIPPLIDDN